MERVDAGVREQLLKDDQQIVGKAFDIAGNNARVIQANTRHMALLLMNPAIPDRASRMAAFAEELIDANITQHIKEPVACARGCSHCCTTYVSTTLPEVFCLAQAVRGKKEKHARVIVAAARSKSMPQLEREVNRVICPILDNHACTEYLHRPVVCRAVLSTSLPSCERIFLGGISEPFAAPPSLGGLRSYVVIMMRAALQVAGLAYRNYELTHALEIALASEDSEQRWLAGEPIFDAVAIDRLDQGETPLTKIVDGLANAIRPTI